jgi:hypothetical protein
MTRTLTRLSLVLAALTVLISGVPAGAQMMGYGPVPSNSGYGFVPPQAMMQPGFPPPGMQPGYPMGGPQGWMPAGPGGIGYAQHTAPIPQEGGESGSANGGKCEDPGCGGGCGGGCMDGNCGLGSRLFGRLRGQDHCGYCDGFGCRFCGVLGIFGRHGPWAGGTGQCCYPRWYDIAFDALYLKRENTNRFQEYSKLGLDGLQSPPQLDSDSFEFDFMPGFRGTLQMLVGPGSNVEVSYFGTFNWASSARLRRNNNVYSVLSDYGDINRPNGFLETDIADLHTVEYSGDLNSVELNVRRRWVSRACHFQSSFALGARYVRIDEAFKYNTYVRRPDPAGGVIRESMDYTTQTWNDMIGFQLAMDSWACITPGFSVGGDVKAGIYGNRGRQQTVIEVTTPGTVPLIENATSQEPSFVGEANLQAIYHVNSHLTLRCGYMFLYVEGVAMGAENFNPVAPAVLFPGGAANRTVAITSGGYAFYHGGTAGFEWTW